MQWPFTSEFVETHSTGEVEGDTNAGRKQRAAEQKPAEQKPMATLDEVDMQSAMARLELLENENAKLREDLDASRREVQRWSLFSAQIFNSIVLSPDACAYYKELARKVLTQGLEAAALTVGYADCSFPSTSGNAPTVELVAFESLGKSLWNVLWAPAWHINVSASGSRAMVPYNTFVQVSEMQVRGSLQLELAPDLSKLTISFVKKPSIEMTLTSSLKLGAVPMPLVRVVDRAIRSTVDKWIESNLVMPKSTIVKIDRLSRKSQLTANDMALAKRAAAEASLRLSQGYGR